MFNFCNRPTLLRTLVYTIKFRLYFCTHGLSVTSSSERLYGRILKNRIGATEEQSGSRADKFCIDNVFCFKQLREKAANRGMDVSLKFIDLRKS